jgi:hypothetical protein
MADVTTTFAAKDESFAKTVTNLQGRLTEFGGGVGSFNNQVAGMASSFAKFAGPIAGIATAFFGAKAAVDSFGNALAMGGRLDDLSKRTGASAGEMLLLEKAFGLAGSSAEAVGPTISKLNKFLAEASTAGSAQDATLRNLGLTYTQLSELSPSEQMRLLAERITAIESPALKTQAAMAVFGKSGGELIPLLSSFSGEVAKAAGYLGSLPDIMNENAAAFADLDDNINEIRGKFDQFTSGLITGMVPALTSVTDKLANLDAAGLGQAFSEYITSAAQAVSDSFLLGDAIDSVKIAIDGIISGNYSDGLSLMWTTMKITALNAVDEIVRNFTAGMQTVGNFIATMFAPSGALILLIQSIGTIVSSSLLSKIGTGLADLLSGLGPMFESAAESARYNAETATRAVEMNMQSLGSQIELVGEQATEAGKAMPQSFADNYASLNPLFDLKDEFAEQKRLQEEITAKLIEAKPEIAAIAASAKDFGISLSEVPATLQSTIDLSGQLSESLYKAKIGAQGVASAFELGTHSSGQISFDLNSTSESANQASNFLGEGADATNALNINGKSYKDSAEEAANILKRTKGDATIIAEAYTGMSDRMSEGATKVNQSIEKMREAHHFGQKTQEEMYQNLRKGGYNIYDATKLAGQEFVAQTKLSTEMRKTESRTISAENARERAMDRAAAMEKNNQDVAANNLRRRTEEKFMREMDKLGPAAEKGSEQARKMLEDGGSTNKDSVTEGGDAAKKALEEGAEAIKDATGAGAAQVAPVDPLSVLNEIKLFLTQTFFTDFKKRLPQNALG